MARDVAEGRLNHEYPPLGGQPEFINLTAQLVFGNDSAALAARQVLRLPCSFS